MPSVKPLNDLSERFACSTKETAGKAAFQAFGWLVEGGMFKAGLLYTPERVRVKSLTLKLYEPDAKENPVYLGEVTIKLKNHLKPCGPGAMHVGLEFEVIHAS